MWHHITVLAHIHSEYNAIITWLQFDLILKYFGLEKSTDPDFYSVLQIHWGLRTSASINQSNVYVAYIPGEARLSGATAESVFNSKIEETVP